MAFDPDLGKTGFALRLFRLRFRTVRLSQQEFARRFGLTLGSIKDLEQGRVQPSRAMVLLVAAIEADPKAMANVAIRERAALNARPSRGHRWKSAGQPATSR